MKIIEKFSTKNDCYKNNMNKTNSNYTNFQKNGPKGLMLHSVGCPQDDALVFVNNWNKSGIEVAVHAVLQDDGTVYQCLPWNYRAWHAGGSANNTHIGVEMTEPDCIKYTGGSRFTCSNVAKAKEQVAGTYKTAVELFAYLCNKYNLDPMADGVIICHAEGYKRGIASNHGDVTHLWDQLGTGYTMDGFRKDVKKAMGSSGGSISTTAKPESSSVLYRVQTGAYSKKENAESQLAKVKAAGFDGYMVKVDSLYKIQVGAYSQKANATAMAEKLESKGFDAFITTTGGQAASVADTLIVGDTVKMQKGAPVYNMSYGFNDWVYDSVLYVREIKGNCVVVSTQKTGAVTGSVDKKYLIKI